MITFKLNGKKVSFPSSWTDLTFDQYLKIMVSTGGIIDIIALFTGIEPSVLKQAKISGMESIITTLAFLKEPHKFDSACNQAGKYSLPVNSKGQFNIQLESLAQFEDMRSAMSKVETDDIVGYTKAYATYVSIYLQKIRDGEYNSEKASDMIPEIMEMPAHEVITLGGFFFIKLLSLLNGIDHSSQTTRSI